MSQHNSRAPIPLLIVEDSPVYAEILLHLLPSLGAELPFVPTWVDSAEKALIELEQKHFELAFLDYKLPGADGLSLLARIQLMPEGRRPAVIMLTGIGREEVAVEAMKSGAKDYLSKDHIDVPSLLRAITTTLDRKHTENALAEERALLRALMDSAPDYIYFKDTHSHFTCINAAFSRALNLPRPEDAIGKTDADFYPPDFARQTREDERRIIEQNQSIISQEEQLQLPNGQQVWVSATKIPLRDRQGRTTGLLGISRDITQSKQLENELAHTAGELALKNSQLQSDIEMAREIQEAFLPAAYPTFPSTATPEQSALHFHHRYRPAAAVGGDFFHIIPINDTTAGVLICDVMGHGVRAALITAILRALIEQHKSLAHDPSAFLQAINHTLVTLLKQTRMPIFATAFYLVADTQKHQLRYANAGHPSPCHIHHDNGHTLAQYTSPIKPGSALGVFADSTYNPTEAPLDPGDTILLYTDGLFEAEGTDDTRYGHERLLASIQRHAALPTSKLLDQIIADIEQFADTPNFHDDLCIVAIETDRSPNK